MRRIVASGATAVLLALSVPAMAATDSDKTVDLKSWNYDKLYSGLSADELIDMTVQGPDGDDLGEIQDLILGQDGNLKAIIIEAGGFLDIGDTHFRVPWNEVKMLPDDDAVQVPVEEGNVEDYALFDGEYVPMEAKEWKASDLMDDWATLKNGVAFGLVQDIVFTPQGKLDAVVVDTDETAGYRGPYALPYYRAGFNPYLGYWATPYSRDEVLVLDTFDDDKMEESAKAGSMESQQEPAAGQPQDQSQQQDQPSSQ